MILLRVLLTLLVYFSLLSSTRTTQPQRTKTGKGVVPDFMRSRGSVSSSTEVWPCFTPSHTPPPEMHSRLWPHKIRAVRWLIGGLPWPTFTSFGSRPFGRDDSDGAKANPAGAADRGWLRTRAPVHNDLGLIYQDAATVPYRTRALNYEHALSVLASENRKDVETQVLYALALLANASPTDKTLARQKEAAALLEPLDRVYAQHPGIPHYLIHAYDNAELSARGLAAARAYSRIAPSAPHALHMPSHIFTRLGLWEDSIASNLVAREAARQQGDTGEELHAMDYLVYAYLQSGRETDAVQVIQQLKKCRD